MKFDCGVLIMLDYGVLIDVGHN